MCVGNVLCFVQSLIEPLLDIVDAAMHQKDTKEFSDRVRRVLGEVFRPKKVGCDLNTYHLLLLCCIVLPLESCLVFICSRHSVKLL